MNFEIICDNEAATAEIGNRLGELLNRTTTLYLHGTLGSGKTRFVQAMASGLGIDQENVSSPTFTIMTPHRGRLTLLHVDAYRIADLDEAEQLGIDDWIDSGCVLAVEWAEKIQPILPAADLNISIQFLGDTVRKFEFAAASDHGRHLIDQLMRQID